VQLSRTGFVQGRQVKLTKGISLNAGEGTLEIAYMLENVPSDIALHLAPEFNFAGLPSGADDRYFSGGGGQRLGQLGHQLDLQGMTQLSLTDEWLGITVNLKFDQPASIWTYPVETVSQSEGGFELVHQSVAVLPHWTVIPDAEGRWSMTMRMEVDTQLAESRMPQYAEAAAV
jgi:alpha-amylase